MIRHPPLALGILAGWLLLHGTDPRGGDWREVGSYGTESACDYGRQAAVERATLTRIGGVLASQPVDNPMRQHAYRQAQERVQPQYRCVRE